MERLAFILFLFLWIPETVQGRDQWWTGCYTPQYAEINQEGYIMCQFPPNFKEIFWYDDASNDDSIPIITSGKNVTGGVGYDSGEYSLFSNGSLIIYNVSMDHDRSYKVLYFDQEGLYNVFSVSLTVTVTPIDRRPKIEGCSVEDICLIQASSTSTLTCSLRGSRPHAWLQWFKQTDEGLELISTTIETELNHNDNRTMNVFSHLDFLGYSNNLLVSFVCEAALESKANFMSTEGLVDTFSVKTKVKSYVTYYKINGLANFTCSLDKPKTLLWKVKLRGEKYETLAILQGGKSKVFENFLGDFILYTNGTLVAPVVKLSHEGEYVCFTNESTANDILTAWNLTIIVPPSPSHVVVAECPSVYDRQCIIESSGNGTLTCSVSGVRPPVTLEWIVTDDSRVTLSGQKQSTTVSKLFDSTLSTEYTLTTKVQCNELNILKCSAYGPTESIFHSSHQTILLRVNCSSEESGQTPPESHVNSIVIGIVGIFMIILEALVLVFGKYFNQKRCRKQHYQEVPQQNSTSESKFFEHGLTQDSHEVPEQNSTSESKFVEHGLTQDSHAVPEQNSTSDGKFVEHGLTQDYHAVPEQINTSYSEYKRSQFIDEVRQKYENMLNQSHPKVYVPNNLYLRTQHGNWRNRSRGDKLNGYQDLFKNEKLKNRNLFIEGDMGFGKTTLALQFIKMWLNEDQNLDFGLVLYLSLQNVAFENEYTCIRTQLLSETCDIDDITIQEIIANEERVLFVFDDWDQFNNRHSKKSFVYKLFVNKQKEEHKVLILTRPSLAGEVFSDERPIVKIAQFDDEQIQKYLKETLKRKNINGIFEGIVDNSSIYELCQIPLFLSVIAPIIEDDMFNIEHDETVTKLFLSVFPSLINRKEAGNDGALALFDYNPKLALLAAAGYTTQESFWPKEKVASLIGRTELNDLIKTKILTETSERKQLSEDLLKMESKCKIHFSHNIFQCFYGAHYLAFDASSEEIGDYLHNTDILICQYLFIFACGLSNDKQLLVTIVRSLLQREEYYPFPISDCIALCCFEAKPGKLEHKLLSEISASEHRFHIKASDGRNVVNAKAFLIDSCAKEKVEFGSLAITEHVKEIGSDKITLSTGTSFELPGIIKSYYIVAFENKITNEDLLALIKGSRRLQILFLYNKSEPEYECAELFETTDLEKTLVVWVYCQAEDLTLFTLSSKFKCWTSLEGSLTIKELRKTDLWKDSANLDKMEKEYRMLLRRYQDIGNFLNSRTELDTNWRLRTERYIRGIAATFTQYVNTWHKVYTSRNAEKMKKNSIALSEVINDLSDQLKKMGYNDFDPEEKDIIVDNPKEFLELIPSIKKIFLNIHQL